jgi:hypothetical protein
LEVELLWLEVLELGGVLKASARVKFNVYDVPPWRFAVLASSLLRRTTDYQITSKFELSLSK